MSEETTCPTCGDDSFETRRATKIHHARAHDERLVETDVCEECGETYEPTRQNQQYCSRKCQGAARKQRIEKTCPHCGESFEVRPSEQRLTYCSRECQRRDHRITMTCEECGDTVEIQQCEKDRRRFCSADCRYEAHGGWGDGPRSQTCEACGRTFQRYEVGPYCSHACRYETQRKRPRPDDPNALLHELYVTDDHNWRETWLRFNAAREGDYWTKRAVKDRLKELDIFREQSKHYGNAVDADPDVVGPDTPDGDDSWREYYRGESDD